MAYQIEYTQVCPKCMGSGDMTCPRCNGSGYDPYDSGQCERCEGTGEVTCTRCDGNGAIIVKNKK